MPILRDELQAAVGNAYAIGDELHGGGMSHVFVAEEVALGRKVVIKLLPPDMLERASVERFKREIQLAANLQHPHIVPILAAGATSDAPFYTMPFVEGASLRARLDAGGPLPIAETVVVLRDVARALAYAHEHGIVHRDIKPDNVLLSGGSAAVTDFGIAKALERSRHGTANARPLAGSQALTSVGTSLGTPAYMAPEQAAGDPATDHRADIYSFGCMMYEVLAGQPPFVAPTPQRLFAAHMVEVPRPVTALRPETPPALAELVMRCLAKEPSERPQQAADVVRVLESVGTGEAAGLSAPMLVRAGVAYAAAFVGVALVARWVMIAFGLPDWVFPGALIIMALGLPAILLTGYVQATARRSLTLAGRLPSGVFARLALKARPYLTWKRTARNGVGAVAAFGVAVVGFVALRAAGVGPFASLLSAGTLGTRDRVLVADFSTSAADTALSGVLAEAARTSLAQSRVVSLMPASAIAGAMRRMQRPAGAKLDAAVARDIAVREGVKAVLVGKAAPFAGGYVVTETLVAASTGDELASYQETVNGPQQLIESIDRLTRRLRGKIGESLRTIRAERPLEQVTTSSLDALEKYSQGVRANNFENNFPKATRLFEEAIAADSTFGMAYRTLAQVLTNQRIDRERALDMLDKAFALREHMTERERLFTLANYYGNGRHADRAKEIEAYEELLQVNPNEWGAMQNLAQVYATRREFARAESLWVRAMSYHAEQFSPFNIIGAEISEGHLAEARRSHRLAVSLFPANARGPLGLANILYNEGKLDSAEVVLPPNDPLRSTLATVRGRRTGGAQAVTQSRAARTRQVTAAGNVLAGLADSLSVVQLALWQENRPAEAVRRLDAALERTPLSSLPPAQRDYLSLATFYGAAQRPDRARDLLHQYDAAVTDTARRRLDQTLRDYANAWLALADGHAREAMALFRKADSLPDGPASACVICADPGVGMAYERAGVPDSAIVAYEHFVTTPSGARWNQDILHLPWILRRLGELYEAKQNPSKAATYYSRFVDLWKNADPSLQTQVAEGRRRLMVLTKSLGN